MKTFNLIRKLLVFIGLFTAVHIQAQTVYYVKVDGSGTLKDGSSWENAMSNDEFARILPTVPDGTTFHIAEGKYFKVNNDLYLINSSVTLIGGYPANATTASAPFDPGKYKTVFDGNLDSQTGMIHINNSVLKVNLKGLYVENTTDIVINCMGEELYLDYVTFTNNNILNYQNNNGIILVPPTWHTKTRIITIENSSFYKNNNCPILFNRFNNTEDQIKITLNNVTMEENHVRFGALILCSNIGKEGVLVMNNVKAKDNTTSVVKANGKNITITNSEFENNRANYYNVIECGASDNLTISDSKIVNNNIENTYSGGCCFLNAGMVTIERTVFEENKGAAFAHLSSNAKNLSINNCTFKNGEGVGHENINTYSTGGIVYNNGEGTVKINKSIFENNKGNVAHLSIIAKDIEIDNCVLSKGKANNNLLYNISSAVYSESSSIKFTNSTFSENTSESELLDIRSTNINLTNNTFVKNQGSDLFVRSSDMYLINNTIVGNELTGGIVNGSVRKLTGNIIVGNRTGSRRLFYNITNDVEYNIMPVYFRYTTPYSTDCHYPPGENETNIFVEPEGFTLAQFSALYDGCTDLTRTTSEMYKDIIVGNDIYSLLDGTYNATTGLFNPNLKNNGGFTPTVALLNTTLPNGKKVNSLPTSISNVLSDQRNVERNIDAACIGAYEYPKTQQLEYYVKEAGAGLMDGSSWENAMSNEIFAGWLPDAPDGVTFYIAEGVYKPVFEGSENWGLEFETNSNVSLIGGYRSEITEENESPEPKLYKTIFTADIMGNDNYFTFGNMEDNLKHILHAKQGITLKNIVFEGAIKYALGLSYTSGGFPEHYIDHCTFRYNNSKFENAIGFGSAITLQGGFTVNTFITDSYFYQNKGNHIIGQEYSFGNISIENTTFNENEAYISLAYFLYPPLDAETPYWKIVNSTFTNNTATEAMIQSNFILSLYNNTFVNNNSKSTFDIYASSQRVQINQGPPDNNIIGNLFFDDVIEQTYRNDINRDPLNGYDLPIVSQYNIYLTTEAGANYIGGTDLFIAKEDIVSILEGPWNGTNFAPNLKDNGGFTPTVALTSTLMPGGNEFVNSVPTDISGIFKDQRGVNRGNPACIGAYEYFAPCETITASLSNNPITSESHTLTLMLTKPARTKIYLLDKGGNRINSIPDIVNESYSTGTHEVRLNDLFRRNLDPLTPYILVIETDEQKSFMYLYVSKI